MATTQPPQPWVMCTAHIQLGNFYIGEPLLIPTCMLALYIGVTMFLRIRPLKEFVGHVTYSTTFLMFGIMMTSAFFVHCAFAKQFLNPPPSLYAVFFGILDVSLTSCIGLSWSFNGLVDVGLVKEGWKLYSVMFLSFAGLFAQWSYQMLHAGGPNGVAFLLLYFGPILLSAVIYSLCQLWRFFHGETEGWLWFLGAEITAFLGVLCASSPPIAKWFCTYLGPTLSPWLNADFWWFILSDASMYCYARYFLARTTKLDKRGYTFQLMSMPMA